MKIHLPPIMALTVGMLSAQVQMNYSYELQYGKGQQVLNQASANPDTVDYSYFENLLDINTYFGDNIYSYTQFEYSNPPIYGYNRNSIDSILTTFYIEYSRDKYNIKIGDLYELYGRGLSYYAFQDQNVDYQNNIRGLNAYFFLKDNIKFSTLIGTGEYAFRSLPSNRKTNYQFNTNVGLGAIDYENQLLGYFQLIYLQQQSFFPADIIDGNTTLIGALCNDDNELGQDLRSTASLKTQTGTCLELGSYPFTVNTSNFNFTWNYFLGPLDIYIDKAWIYYDKIHAEEVFGSRFYTSIYTEILEMGITYEYKNYFTPYLIKSMSNPPIVYREGSSILASRNAHSINFGNEIGHQIDINKNLFGNMNLAANIALSHRYKLDDMESINVIDILSLTNEEKIYDYYPFRQIYFEINGWTNSEQLYYKIGIDNFFESTFIEKQIYATTIPTQWVVEFENGNSFTMYLEAQTKRIRESDFEYQYVNHYSSLSYSHHGKWIVTGFYDQEIKDDKSNRWLGSDFSYKLNTETMVSIFYGSQKGGLVCANGICAEQPGFENGIKITLRSLF